jgi:hypothetical protein
MPARGELRLRRRPPTRTETTPHAIEGQDAATQSFRTLSAGDQGVDLRNNIIGRDIGARMARGTTGKVVAEGAQRAIGSGQWPGTYRRANPAERDHCCVA